VTGATGTGKTLLGAQFTQAGLDAGERVLFLSFEERITVHATAAHLSKRRAERNTVDRRRLTTPRSPSAPLDSLIQSGVSG
jgi:KaiC/GvpD/RAD55 family RecA-like ATPase